MLKVWIAGAILGIILCYLVPDSSFKKDVIVEGILYEIGQGFIRLMKMLVVPLVFCSLVCGSMAIGLIMGIDRILDMTRTAVNITGDAVCTTIVAHQNGALDKNVFNETE